MIGLGAHVGPFWWFHPIGRRKTKATAWMHRGCSIKHESEAAAMLCRNHDLYP